MIASPVPSEFGTFKMVCSTSVKQISTLKLTRFDTQKCSEKRKEKAALEAMELSTRRKGHKLTRQIGA